MSFDAQAWARKIKTGSMLRKAVLMSIANRANDADGACWPSQKRIADEIESCERAVRNALGDLEDMNLIRRVKRRDTTDLIYLNMQDPGDGSTITPPAPRSGGNARRSAANDNRNDVPRHEMPGAAVPDSGDDRNDVPVGAESDAGDHRNDVPPNLSDEPTLNRSDEPKEKRRALNSTFPADSFDQFWALYPDKKARKKCAEIWEDKILTGKTDFEEIIGGLRKYIRCKPKDRPWLNPSTFLNQARWEDEWDDRRPPDRGPRAMAI
ncbi:helix-turn-helix domain-containing protein [Bradyrhizobium pachyrhizi]|uniref:helix-turn-helix domain-containing protein n=1 Tax=Bradyrhizobium pachyrhizi TaxID=280333 RepID=UPI0024B0FC0A|nr:helix-turn-helix domain-containing protein [Bradyrhizobium pachyrhizi]WFU52208.1 helix-turn-helix domain-containing protein [Bradyrhizobium pachyrhizi]